MLGQFARVKIPPMRLTLIERCLLEGLNPFG
jgi:hypothetical protein